MYNKNEMLKPKQKQQNENEIYDGDSSSHKNKTSVLFKEYLSYIED